ncbi:MAG TPA: DUF3750 domain-containing protein [Gammaproteobacteria bacterium]
MWLVPPLLFGLAYLDQVEGFVGGAEARRAPVGLAPDPKTTAEPVVQVYAARAVRWRGYFGVHTWVSVKRRDAAEFTTYEVNGWRLRRTGTAVSVDHRPPDARWFGNRPELLADLRGEGVEELITRMEQAVESYPYADTYRVWPGPNSNTFVAHVLRSAPELRVDLPATAIGKDYLDPWFVASSPSGTGAQLNVFGLVGALVGLEEGVELSILGATFGVDALDLSLKLPLAGRLGWPRPDPIAVAAAAQEER